MLVVLPEYTTAGLATVSSEPQIYVPSGSGAELLLDDLDNLYWLHIISGDVYFRRYNSSHTLEVPDKSLYTSGSNLNVDAVWDDFGNIHFTWATDVFGAQSNMYAKIDKNGHSLVSPVKLSGDNNALDFCSAIDVNSLGQAYVAWDYWWDPPDWKTQDVLYAKIDSDGSTIFTQQYVAPVGWDSDFRWKKDILVDNDDNLHVIFDNNPSGVDLYYYYKKFASDGTTVLVSEKQLFPIVYKTWSTSLEAVLDSQDRINLAFGPGVPGGMVETFYARIDLLGNLEIGPIQLSTGPSYHSAYPYLAIDDYDNNYVFWSDYETGNADIYYSALDMNGSVVVPPTRLTDDNLTQHSSYMGAVFDSTNTCIWSYFDGDIFGGDGTHVIYARPPETTIVVGLPRYSDSPTFVTSATDFSFTVLDQSGSGIRGTYYHVDSGGWLNYSLGGPFTVIGEGPHSIFYNSTDNLGINEPTKMFDIVVDDTPPTSSLTPGEPNYTSGQTWITSLTPIPISTIDGGVIPVGINSTRYRVWNGGPWTPWADYSTPFSIGPVEGVSHVEFFSEDLLWNQEPTQNATLIVDNTPPSTNFVVGYPRYRPTPSFWWNVTSSTPLALSSEDGGPIPVGISTVECRVYPSPTWVDCSSPFNLSGYGEGHHRIEFRSIDLLDYQEEDDFIDLIVDDSPPYSTLVPGLPRYISTDIWVTSNTQFQIVSPDDGSPPVGTNYSLYRVWNGGSSSPWTSYSSPFALGQSEGYSYVEYYAVDLVSNQESIVNESFIVDNTPPTTSMTIGTPNHTTTQIWISSSTPISVNSVDGGLIPVGLNHTKYRVWNGGSWTIWNDYTVPFTVGPGEGICYVEAYSSDLLWNNETVLNATYIVDNTPPVTKLHVGEPNYTATDTWVNSSTPITLTATDGGSVPVGVNRTLYRNWAGSWGSWEEYSASFRLSTEGLNFVEYRSIDLLANQESAWNESLIVDDTPPTTLAEIGGPKYRGNEDAYWNVTSSAKFYLNSTDGGPVPCGVRAIEFSIDEVLIGNYSEPFTLQGYEDGIHRMDFRAIDNMMNAESRLQEHNTVFVNLDNTPPSSTIEPNKTNIDLREAIALEADDGQGSGVQEILFSIDGGEWQTYTEEFSLDEYGHHTISYRSVDNLGNAEQPKELAFEIPRPSENWKPLIALAFTIILLVCGLVVSRRRPIEFQTGKSFAKTFLLISFPFWLAEAITGIVSLVTGWLSIPPFLGIGTFLDLGILVVGLAVLAIHGKGEEESNEEDDSGNEGP